MKSSKFLLIVATAWIVGCASQPAVKAQAAIPSDRPNFLFIYTDDQRWDAMSCVQKEQGSAARFPWFQTPNMDRLAREGMRFRNAFVVNSLCSPSRSNFLTGKYSHLNGVANNHSPMPLDTHTYASYLRDAGYTTAYFGKFHHGNQKERPGFDVVYSYLGQGNYDNCPFNVNGTITPTHGWIDDVTTDYAIDFLKGRKPGDKPFDMVIGFKSPHDPRIPAERAKDRFAGEEARPAVSSGVRPPFRPAPSTMKGDNGGSTDKQGRGGGVLNYFRCISSADDCLGRVLQTLDDLHLADNTIVIYTTDNGYYLGEHTLGDKRSAYDESLRIPLLVRYPKSVPAGKVRDEMVTAVDLAPTLLDYAGVPIPKDIQGRSWRPLLEEKPVDWRHVFFYEYFYEKPYGTPTTTAIRTEGAKLIRYPDHPQWTELFDLKNDPYEMHNLANDPAHADLMKKMEAEYEREAKVVKFKIPEGGDVPDPKVPGHF